MALPDTHCHIICTCRPQIYTLIVLPSDMPVPTCWATTDSTSRSILLNSSKQAQAPADARPLKNCHRRENKVSGRSNHSVCIVILGSARPLKNCQRRENKVSGRSNHSVILGGARPLKNYHRENKISGSSNHSVYIVILVRACVGP